jgi:hypothetical protein
LQWPKYLTKKEQIPPWLPKTRLQKLDSWNFRTMPMKLFCSQTERFPRKKFQHTRKKCMLQFSQKSINLLIFLVPFRCIDKCTVVKFTWTCYESKINQYQ